MVDPLSAHVYNVVSTLTRMARQTLRQKDPSEQPMYVRLPAELHEAVKLRSQQDERTMAQTIRLALRFYLQETTPLTP